MVSPLAFSPGYVKRLQARLVVFRPGWTVKPRFLLFQKNKMHPTGPSSQAGLLFALSGVMCLFLLAYLRPGGMDSVGPLISYRDVDAIQTQTEMTAQQIGASSILDYCSLRQTITNFFCPTDRIMSTLEPWPKRTWDRAG